MKHLFFLFAILFISFNRTQAQEPAIKMKINELVGSSFSFTITVNVENAKIQVDWGDGQLKEYNVSRGINLDVKSILKDNTVIIYGSNISLFDVWSKKLTLLDVSGASELTYLSCTSNQLTTLDISKNTKLKHLYCGNNYIRNLNISNNLELSYLGCENNLLTSIDVSKNISLSFFRLSSNYFTFSKLPIKQSNWSYYLYTPQSKVKLPKRKFVINETIDLSEQLVINGDTTVYRWKKENGTVLVRDVDYSEDNGKFNFLINQDVAIYCEMTNATFPDLILITESIKVPTSTLSIVLETEAQIGNLFSFNIASNIDNNNIQIDWGDSTLVDYIIGINSTEISKLLVGNTIKVYGFGIAELNVQSKMLSKLDVLEATELRKLNCSSNKLELLNLSNNNNLDSLQCQLNRLKGLSLPKNVEVNDIQCQLNRLTFKTLPSINVYFKNYIYYPQLNIELNKRAYDISESIDLSSNRIINNIATVYTWKTLGGLTLKKDIDYVESFGEFKFINSTKDSVFCELTNIAFPKLILRTQTIAINCPNPIFTFVSSKSIGSNISFLINAQNTGVCIVDWGNGKHVGYPGGGYYSIGGILAGDTVKVYGVNIDGLFINSEDLTSIDISGAPLLEYFSCSGNKLTNLSITKNNRLKRVDCGSNKIYSLDLPLNGQLEELDCSQNDLTSLDLSYNIQLTDIDCSGNKLEEINVHENSLLETLNCSANKLTTLDVTSNNTLINLYCNNNELNSLFVPYNSALKTIQCQFNRFTFTTLPSIQNTWLSYNYYSQATLNLLKDDYSVGEEIDLSSQISVDGNPTIYLWKNANGNKLIKGIDYTEDNGKFSFLKTQDDYVFCQLTNSKFPDLVISTDTIAVPSGFPIVTMTTTTNIGQDFTFQVYRTISNKPIQVDWGNGIVVDCAVDYLGDFKGKVLGDKIKVYGIGIKTLFVISQNITDLVLSNTNLLTGVDCSSNQLISIDISKASSLGALNCKSNLFTSLELKSSSLISLNCSSNQLTSIDISGLSSLKNLDCSFNRLSFNTLPLKDHLNDYIYYPQEGYKLPKTDYDILEIIDLSSLYISNGYITSYTWETDEVLTSPVGYYYYNGLFKFQDPCINIFCVMTNDYFPALVLTTERINIKNSATTIDENILKVDIFPNPLKDVLFIECAENISKIEVYTITGKKIYEKRGDNSTLMSISTIDFQKGILLVKIYCKNGSITKKVIKE